jgi:hypothetical protein
LPLLSGEVKELFVEGISTIFVAWIAWSVGPRMALTRSFTYQFGDLLAGMRL